MSLADAIFALDLAPDPLSEVLRTLPFNEAEEVPGQEWARLKSALGLDTAPGKLLVSTIRDKGMGGTYVDPSWEQIERLSNEGHSLYFGLSKVPADWAPRRNGERGSIEVCLPRRFVGVDFDLDFGHHKKAGVSLADTINSIERFQVRPVAVVASGGGLHAYYRLSGLCDAEGMKWVGDRLNGYFGKATDVFKWDTTPTVDIARILRVPGTTNYKAGAVPVRLLHVDETAEPITRAMVEDWETHAELKKRKSSPTAMRPSTKVSKFLGATTFEEGTAPWDAFNEAFTNTDDLAILLERLGGQVSGNYVCMPGAPDWEEPNAEYHGSLRDGDNDWAVVTIHGTGVRGYWAGGSEQSTFDAYDLLTRTFDGDRSATAIYVKHHVLADIEGWLEEFSWAPGDPAPIKPRTGNAAGSGKSAPAAQPAQPTVSTIKPQQSAPSVSPAPVRASGATAVLTRPSAILSMDPFEQAARAIAARAHCAGCCPGTAYAHDPTATHLDAADCQHAAHCVEHCPTPGCTDSHTSDDDCLTHAGDF